MFDDKKIRAFERTVTLVTYRPAARISYALNLTVATVYVRFGTDPEGLWDKIHRSTVTSFQSIPLDSSNETSDG
jgi:hypothetical protein